MWSLIPITKRSSQLKKVKEKLPNVTQISLRAGMPFSQKYPNMLSLISIIAFFFLITKILVLVIKDFTRSNLINLNPLFLITIFPLTNDLTCYKKQLLILP